MIFSMNRKQRRMMARSAHAKLSSSEKQKRNDAAAYAKHWDLPLGVKVDPCWLKAHHPKGKVQRKRNAA